MSYRCQTCGASSTPGKSMRRYVIYREKCYHCGSKGTEVVKEIPVCDECAAALARGISLEAMPLMRSLRSSPSEDSETLGKITTPTVAIALAPKTTVGIEVVDDSDDSVTAVPPPRDAVDLPKKIKDQGEKLSQPRCDICGLPAGNGQVTEHTVLCKFHCNMS